MTQAPSDAEARRAVKPVICYPNDTLPAPNLDLYSRALASAERIETVEAVPRDACSFRVSAGDFFF